MTAGRLVSEAVESAAPGATTGTFAVALVGETDAGWLVDAASAEEAIDIVHGTVPQARLAISLPPLARRPLLPPVTTPFPPIRTPSPAGVVTGAMRFRRTRALVGAATRVAHRAGRGLRRRPRFSQVSTTSAPSAGGAAGAAERHAQRFGPDLAKPTARAALGAVALATLWLFLKHVDEAEAALLSVRRGVRIALRRFTERPTHASPTAWHRSSGSMRYSLCGRRCRHRVLSATARSTVPP